MDSITLDLLAQKGVDTSSWDDAKLQRLNDFIKLKQTATNPKESILGGVTTGAESSLPQAQASIGALTGNYDMVTSGLKKSQEIMSTLGPDLQKRVSEISDPESFVKTILNMGDDPNAAAVLLGQSLPPSVLSGLMALTGGKAASMVGAAGARKAVEMGIFGAGSALNEAGSAILETMSEAGVDVTDDEQVKAVLEDPDLYSQLVQDGLKKGIPVGAFDALSYHLAGRHIGAEGLGLKSGLKETAEQAATGMAGEATGQIWQKGEITNKGDIALEGAFEGITGVPQAIIQPALRNGLDTVFKKGAPKTEDNTSPVSEYEVDVGDFIEKDAVPFEEVKPASSLADVTNVSEATTPVKDKGLEKESRDASKPAKTLTIPSEVLRGTHKQMRSRLMSLPLAELEKRATINAGISKSSLLNEKGLKMKKSEIADAILGHYGVVPTETEPNKVQVGRDPASRLKAKTVEDNLPIPDGATLDKLIELANSSPSETVKNVALDWVKSIQSRKAAGTITLNEADSKKIDEATKGVSPEVVPAPTEMSEEEAKQSLSNVKGGNKRFQDAVAALTRGTQSAGNTREVYHGTPHNFDKFENTGKEVSGKYHGDGFYFTEIWGEAKEYAGEEPTSRIIKAKITTNNPFDKTTDMDFKLTPEEVSQIARELGEPISKISPKSKPLTFRRAQWLNKQRREKGVNVSKWSSNILQAHGFDSIKVGEGEWVVFDNKNIDIKSSVSIHPTTTVNPILAAESLSEVTSKPEAIKVQKGLEASPTIIQGMTAPEAITKYNDTGDQRYLIHVIQNFLNSKYLTDKEKATLNSKFPEIGRLFANEMGIPVDDESIKALKESPNLQPYILASLLDDYLNGKQTFEDLPRLKSVFNKIKSSINKNYGELKPKVSPSMTTAKAISIVKANVETVKEAASWKTLDAYRKLSSDLGVYLDKEPKLVLGTDAFKTASDASTLGMISRSMDVFRSMPSLARKYEFFQPIMDMYMQRDNFRHTVLQTHLKTAEKIMKKYGEARSTKALEVLDIMSRPNQKDGIIQSLTPTEAGNIRYTGLDGKLKELDTSTSRAVIDWQNAFKQNLAIIAQTVKTDMHQYGINPTSNDRLGVLNKINEFRATNMNREADRLQNALNLLDTFDEMFKSNEAYFPHTRARGPYAIAVYAYESNEKGIQDKKPTMVGFYSVKGTRTGGIDNEDLAKVKLRIQKDQEDYGSSFVTIDGNNVDMAKPFYKTTNTLRSILMKNATNTSLAYEAVSSLLSQKGIDPKVVNEMFDELKLNHNIEKLFTNLRRKKGYYGYDNDDYINTAVNHLINQSSLLTSYRYRPRIDSAFSKIGMKLGQAGPVGSNILTKLQRYQDYMTNPEEEWTWIRSLNYWYFLAGNPSTMGLQLLSTHLFTVPWVSQFTGFGGDFLRANYKVFTNYPKMIKILRGSSGYVNSDPVKLSKEASISISDAKILINLKKEGMLDPGYAVEAVGDTTSLGKVSRYPVARKILNKIAVEPMQVAENMGRMNTALLLLDMLNRGDNLQKIGSLLYKTDNGFRVRVDNQYGGKISKEAVIRQAIDENHAVFGKRGRAPYMRGPVGAIMFAFQTYPQQMLENLARLAFDRGFAGRKAFLMMMFVYPIMFGGLLSVPMFDTWDWLMRVFAKQAQKRNTNLSLELSRALNEIGFDDENNIKRMLLHGPVFQGIFDVDVSSRLGLQAWFQPFLNAFADPTEGFGSTAQDKLLGGFSTIEANMRQAKSQIQEGDPALPSYATAFLPTALKNVVKAKDIMEGDIESTKGVNVITPQSLGKLAGRPITQADLNDMAWKRFLGANPDLISQANELRYQDAVRKSEYTEAYTGYNKKVSQYLQDSILAGKTGNAKEKLEAQKKIANTIKDLVEFNKGTRNPKDPNTLIKDMLRAVRIDLYKNMFPLMIKNKNEKVDDVLNELSLPDLEGRAMNRVELP